MLGVFKRVDLGVAWVWAAPIRVNAAITVYGDKLTVQVNGAIYPAGFYFTVSGFRDVEIEAGTTQFLSFLKTKYNILFCVGAQKF